MHRGSRHLRALCLTLFVVTSVVTSTRSVETVSAFDAPWTTLPSFEPIPVAVIDSGVDAGHPDLAGKILDKGLKALKPEGSRVVTVSGGLPKNLSSTD